MTGDYAIIILVGLGAETPRDIAGEGRIDEPIIPGCKPDKEETNNSNSHKMLTHRLPHGYRILASS